MMKKYVTLKTVALSVAMLFVLYFLLTGLVAPWAGKRIAVNFLTNALGRQTRIESITFNPFTLETRIRNFTIESNISGENLISVQELYLNLSTASLLHLAPVLSDIQVTAPKLSLHLNKDNTFNISDLLDGKKENAVTEPDSVEDEPRAWFEFSVSNVKITDGALVFTDHIRSVTHSVAQLNVDLPFVSTMEKDVATPVKAVLNCLVDKARMDINVAGVPFDATRNMSFSLNMLPLDLNVFTPYLDLPVPYKIKSAGALAVIVSGEYEITAGKTVADQRLAVKLQALLNNFDLDNVAGGDLFACPRLKVEASSQNIFDMDFLVDEVVIDHASVFIERNAQGDINLVPPGKGAKEADPPKAPAQTPDRLNVIAQADTAVSKDAEVGLGDVHRAQVQVNRDKKGGKDPLAEIGLPLKTEQDSGGETITVAPVQPKQATPKQVEPGASAPAWAVTINKTVLAKCQVQFTDLAKNEPVNVVLKDIGVTVENITTKKGEKSAFKASMTNKGKGEINLDGFFDISGPAATVNIDVSRIDVNTAEPYFTDLLNISISKGYLNTKGVVIVTPAKKRSNPPNVTYKGRVSLNDFLSKNKVDDSDFFSCKSLYAAGMDISVNPMKVVIDQIALTDFYQRAVLNRNAQLNYTQIMVAQPEEKGVAKGNPKAPSGKGGGEMPDIRINAITLQGGHINFSDYFTQPNFTANMTEIAGSLTGLSSKGQTHAQLVLKGVHGRYAPLDITGELDPLKDKPFIDLTISFKNIELPKFNVYSKKFLGYEIEKGKLILDLHYNIDGDQLNSKNRVLFDQLTLGKKVASKDATSLPLEFAVSLLKNSKGEIDLDLPITGDLSDPKFHFGKVAGTVLKNFIMGIVTAPFKFLGNLVGAGSGQDLGYVVFDPGKSLLDQVQKEKLDKLAAVLGKKPKLKLEIMSRYNPLKDAGQLRYEAYEAMVLSMDKKLPEDGTVRLDDLEEEKRIRLIKASYDMAEFPKPRDGSGKEKELSPDEKEKLL
ncbi:MAG: DUF748 domain-containing protein, partial [Desulfobacterales bacterium]|nr:DUF748 domain-containing protein [Desulfobacterales bacterium]